MSGMTMFFAGFIVVGFLIVIYGFITGKNVSPKIKRLYIQKFALMALIPFTFSFIFFRPYISSSARTSYLDELKTANLTSIEEVAKFEKDQTKQIERLKLEVESLRDDLSDVNDFYAFMLQLFIISSITISIGFIFRRNKQILEIENSE